MTGEIAAAEMEYSVSAYEIYVVVKFYLGDEDGMEREGLIFWVERKS